MTLPRKGHPECSEESRFHRHSRESGDPVLFRTHPDENRDPEGENGRYTSPLAGEVR